MTTPGNLGAKLWDEANQGSDHTAQRGQPPMIQGGPNGVVYGQPGLVCSDETGQLYVKTTGMDLNTGWDALSTGGGGSSIFTWEPTSLTSQQFWSQVGFFAYDNASSLLGVTAMVYNGVTNREGIDIENAPDLVSFSAPNLTQITEGGYFRLSGNAALESVNVGALTVCAGNFLLIFNPLLVDLSGIESLTSCNFLSLDGGGYADISGLNSLTTFNGISVSSNPALIDISGFSSIINAGSFSISSNPLLTDITGFAAMKTCAAMVITNNSGLLDLSGFDSLLTASGDVRITGNANLDVSGFNALTSCGSIEMDHSSSLLDISGFNSLTTCNEWIADNCQSLVAISGFDALNQIAGNVNFSQCALSVASVNKVLATLVAATSDGSTPWAKQVDLSGQTPPAPPSGQGITDAGILTGRGATVTTD